MERIFKNKERVKDYLTADNFAKYFPESLKEGKMKAFSRVNEWWRKKSFFNN